MDEKDEINEIRFASELQSALKCHMNTTQGTDQPFLFRIAKTIQDVETGGEYGIVMFTRLIRKETEDEPGHPVEASL